MADCTNVGTAGNAIPANFDIPLNVLCNIMGFSQSSRSQTVQVTDVNGSVVAEISSSGEAHGDVKPMQPSGGHSSHWMAYDPPYTLTISNSDGNGQTSQVLGTGGDGITYNDKVYAKTWTFIAEDSPVGGDCDFNDSTVVLTWNLKSN